jgi:serine/threonine-protein kinase
MGTSLYSAPEQLIIGGVSDYRTDIYCLGSTMYQLITGELPSSNMKERLGESKYLSNGIKAIIIKCIEKEKTKRYNDMEELKDYLNAQYKYTISIMVNDENKIKIIPVIIIVLSLITYLTVIIGLNI